MGLEVGRQRCKQQWVWDGGGGGGDDESQAGTSKASLKASSRASKTIKASKQARHARHAQGLSCTSWRASGSASDRWGIAFALPSRAYLDSGLRHGCLLCFIMPHPQRACHVQEIPSKAVV